MLVSANAFVTVLSTTTKSRVASAVRPASASTAEGFALTHAFCSGQGAAVTPGYLLNTHTRTTSPHLTHTAYTHPQAIAGSVAYVAQETGFFSCLTVRETLQFTARLHTAADGDDPHPSPYRLP